MSLLNVQGDLFTSGAPAIGHGVNVDGIMGGGVAALVRSRYPEVYAEYAVLCRSADLRPGEVQPVATGLSSPAYLLNMATQDRPGASARLDWVREATLQSLHFCRERSFSRLAIPRLGCGIGGLTWEQVEPVFRQAADQYPDVDLAVYFL
jgi:O-acetyl-ADP-ribose deacetylase (regulator of RNase III)